MFFTAPKKTVKTYKTTTAAYQDDSYNQNDDQSSGSSYSNQTYTGELLFEILLSCSFFMVCIFLIIFTLHQYLLTKETLIINKILCSWFRSTMLSWLVVVLMWFGSIAAPKKAVKKYKTTTPAYEEEQQDDYQPTQYKKTYKKTAKKVVYKKKSTYDQNDDSQ